CREGATCTHDLNAADSPTARRATSTITSCGPVFLKVMVRDAGAVTARRAGNAHRYGRGRRGEQHHCHRAVAVKVTVAVYRPVATSGSAEANPMLLDQASPPVALGAVVVPIVNALALAMGIAANAPPASAAPSS